MARTLADFLVRLAQHVAKVCIDAFNLALPRGTGIATYGRNLISTLNTLGHETHVLYGPSGPIGTDDLINTISISDPPTPRKRTSKIARWARTIGAPLGRKARLVLRNEDVVWNEAANPAPGAAALWASQQLFHYAIRAHRMYGVFTPVRFSGDHQPDVVHWTCPLPLWAPGKINICTLHDLIPLTLPGSTSEDRELYLRLCRGVVDRSDHIFAVSEMTRQSAIRLLGVDEDRITTTYQSVTAPAKAWSQSDEATADYIASVFDLGWKDYFLYFGAIEPKKNVGRILEAYLSSGVASKLIIVSGKSWLDAGEAQVISNVVESENYLRRGRIEKFDYMSVDALTQLIRGAKATLFPSLYEGFGLPVLESMMLGTAVITSTAGSLPEIAGDAAMVVDPYDVDAIARAIRTLDEDDDRRRFLEVRGRERGQVFSPEAHAAKVDLIYRKLGLHGATASD